MICPPYLKIGDSVAIVAPARKISAEDISEGIDILRSWGLNVVLSENLLCSSNQFAGTDEQRADDFQKAINDSNIKAIFCARGGYGSIRIIDKIDFSPLISSPKWIIGFSDITVFHSKLNSIGIESIHAPVITTLKNAPSEVQNKLKDALFGKQLKLNFPQNNSLNIVGECTGELIGGNLSILYSLLGSEADIDFSNKILFLEDLDEYLYHIDRMMMCLKRAGKLSNLKALIVGDVSKMNDNTIPFGKSAEEIIHEHVKDYGYPLCFNFPAGHIDDNNPLIFGQKVSLRISDDKLAAEFFNRLA